MRSYYEMLDRGNIISRLSSPIIKGNLVVNNETGLIDPVYTQTIDSPWIFSNIDLSKRDISCGICNNVLFRHFQKDMGNPPSECQSCWKVVASPNTVIQLFDLQAFQQEFGHPSKCGTELRDYVPRLYGGYFYNRSQEEGLDCLELVRKSVPRDIKVILKRGCTEMEQSFGHSHKWQVTEDVKHWEETVLPHINLTMPPASQPEYIKTHIKQRWIKYASSNGDLTYLELTGGKELSPLSVTYEHPKGEQNGTSSPKKEYI